MPLEPVMLPRTYPRDTWRRSMKENKGTTLQKGFTLIEVLVALSIVALTLVAGFKSIATLTMTSTRMDDILLSTLCIENEFIRLRLINQRPNVGHSSTICMQGRLTYTIELDVQNTPNPLFRKIEATSRRDDEPVVKLTTLIGTY